VAWLSADPLTKLQEELQKAVNDERYENTMVLRERLDAILEQIIMLPLRRLKKWAPGHQASAARHSLSLPFDP